MSPCICHGPSNIHTPGICVSHLWLDQVITGMTHQEFASCRRVFVIWPNNIHTHGSCVMTPPFVTGPSYIHITGSCVISPCICDGTKSAAYPLQDVATYPSICWLFVIFLTIDTFISSPSISKLIDDTWTAVKLHKRQCFFFFLTVLPSNWTCYPGMRLSWSRNCFSSSPPLSICDKKSQINSSDNTNCCTISGNRKLPPWPPTTLLLT